MSIESKHSILETKQLRIGYAAKKQTTVVAKDINLKIPKGELVAVLGKNGAGKSTLLRTLTKVQGALDGTVLLKNKELASYTLQQLSTEIGLVLTERLPESQLTVFELVALGRQPYTNWIDSLSEEDLTQIEQALKQTDTLHLRDKHFYELSDGQLQRVLIARALAQDTAIIILDEPTAHLDLHHTIRIFNLLRELVTTTQKTIIISTHHLNLALQFADEFIVMTEKTISQGSKEQLIASKAFENLFSSDLIHFNTSLKQFIVKQKN